MLPQRRSLHLYKTANAKTSLGMHKVLAFELYATPSTKKCDHKINLVKEGGPGGITVIKSDIDLQDVYDNHVQPGQMLYMVHTITKSVADNYERLRDQDVAATSRNFALLDASASKMKVKDVQLGLQPGPLKVIPINLSSTKDYTRLQLNRMYQFLKAGSPVEVRLRLRKEGAGKNLQYTKGKHDAWHWIHERFPHLRPDFLLKAMPEGTAYCVVPMSNGTHVQWVFMPGGKAKRHYGKTSRVQNIAQTVRQAIKAGKQGELPKDMRRALVKQGNEAYSIRIGMPKARLQDVWGDEGVETVFGPAAKSEDQIAMDQGRNVNTKPVEIWITEARQKQSSIDKDLPPSRLIAKKPRRLSASKQRKRHPAEDKASYPSRSVSKTHPSHQPI